MISDHERGTGRTTRQLKALKDKSLFIWVNGYLSGCYNLCQAIGGRVNKAQNTWFRHDGAVIKIYGSDMLLTRNCHRLYGWDFSEIVLDHALVMCPNMRLGLSYLEHSSNLDLIPCTTGTPEGPGASAMRLVSQINKSKLEGLQRELDSLREQQPAPP